MSFADNQDIIREIHKKTISVIMSCETLDHVGAMQTYAQLAIKKLKQFNLVNKREREVMYNIVTNIQFLSKIKYRMIKSGK